MDPAAAELYDAMKAYARRSVASLRAAGVALPSQRYPGWQWVEEDHYSFHPIPDTIAYLGPELKPYHESDDYRRCLNALHQHALIGPRLGKLVGTHLGRTTLDAEGIPDRPVWQILRTDAEFDEIFEGIFWEQYEWLVREEETYMVIAPVSGLVAEEVPIELDQDLEIDTMVSEEVVACLNTGLIREQGMSSGHVFVHSKTAIRLREQWPVIVGEIEGSDGLQPALRRRVDSVGQVINVLRLFKTGTISVPGTVAFREGMLESRGYQWGFSPAPRHMGFERYRIESGEAEPIVALWQKLRNERVTGERFLATALRRFAFAGERSTPEDRLLDLVIAAEALFTPKTQTEVAHKVAFNSAAFLHVEGHSAQEVFRRTKRAYRDRSKVAHGDTVDLSTEDVDTIEGYVRESLKRMVDRVIAGDALSTEEAWNGFTLGHLSREPDAS